MSDIIGNTVGVEPMASTALVEASYPDADPDSRHSDFPYYRPLGGGPVDINPMLHERMQLTALALYRRNPIAHRIIKLTADFAVSGKVGFEAKNKRIQKILEDHWNHPLNDWGSQLHQCILEAGLYGENFLLANVMETGEVTWGAIDPMRVKRVDPDPIDLARPAKIWIAVAPFMAPQGNGNNASGAPPGSTVGKTVINYDGDPKSDTRGLRVGEAMFMKINNVRGALRGLSDIFPLADYLDGLDQFMFALQQRVQHQNNWIWDVTLDGSSDTEIKQWLSRTPRPRPGTVRAHNERVVWQALSPAFASTDSSDHARIFRNYVLAGAGMADWLIGDMSSANRAATESSAAVIMKTMEQRQRQAKHFLEDIFNFVIDQHIIAEALPNKRKMNREFTISMPKIGIRDFQRVANSLRSGAEGIAKLADAKLLDPERAQRVADQLLSQLDLDERSFSESGISEGDDAVSSGDASDRD